MKALIFMPQNSETELTGSILKKITKYTTHTHTHTHTHTLQIFRVDPSLNPENLNVLCCPIKISFVVVVCFLTFCVYFTCLCQLVICVVSTWCLLVCQCQRSMVSVLVALQCHACFLSCACFYLFYFYHFILFCFCGHSIVYFNSHTNHQNRVRDNNY